MQPKKAFEEITKSEHFEEKKPVKGATFYPTFKKTSATCFFLGSQLHAHRQGFCSGEEDNVKLLGATTFSTDPTTPCV